MESRRLPTAAALRQEVQRLARELESNESDEAPLWQPETDTEAPTAREDAIVDRLFEELAMVVEREHFSSDPERSLNPVLRRMVADRLYANRRDLMARVVAMGVQEPSQQVFLLELWNYPLTQGHPEESNSDEEMRAFAFLVQMRPEEALKVARSIDFDAGKDSYGGLVRAFYYTLSRIAWERMDMSPEQLVRALEEYHETAWNKDDRPFGRMLFNFLREHDPLFNIHNVDTLQKFIEIHRESD